MSEETKAFFLESVKSAALLWCNKAISSDDFFKILDKTVNETEKKMKIDPEAWTVSSFSAIFMSVIGATLYHSAS